MTLAAFFACSCKNATRGKFEQSMTRFLYAELSRNSGNHAVFFRYIQLTSYKNMMDVLERKRERRHWLERCDVPWLGRRGDESRPERRRAAFLSRLFLLFFLSNVMQSRRRPFFSLSLCCAVRQHLAGGHSPPGLFSICMLPRCRSCYSSASFFSSFPSLLFNSNDFDTRAPEIIDL